MNRPEKVIYTARVHTTGGRTGASRSDDGRLDVKLSRPGTTGAGTNPEQLFAAGWSACFESAMELVAHKMKVALPADLAIDAEVEPRAERRRLRRRRSPQRQPPGHRA
jgi:Ohr subfamily peroxiredoxin